MNLFYFGTSSRPLLGAYHPPKSDTARSVGVVLCYPFGQEYMRAHRAFRQLAMRLATAGFHVLRFDYSGTGDSSGDLIDTRLADWVDDANSAADELRESAEVDHVAFVGLRLGGAVAAMAAASRTDVSHVVLWDPVVHGSAYLEELKNSSDQRTGPGRNDGTWGVMGFPVTRPFQEDLQALDILHTAQPPHGRRLVLASREDEATTALGAAASTDGRVTYRHVHMDGSWNEVDDYGGALIPVAMIQVIADYLSAEIE
jgi:pimeloyl-ACP methyl ester carboxylesterase